MDCHLYPHTQPRGVPGPDEKGAAFGLRCCACYLGLLSLKSTHVQAGSFEKVKVESLRPLKQQDYLQAVTVVRPSVSQQTVEAMKGWGQVATAESS
eukprot:4391758-Pyramimonas_sp.AAC.2